MKLDSVVIVFQHSTVNMPLLLAHTARQTILVGDGMRLRFNGVFESVFDKEG